MKNSKSSRGIYDDNFNQRIEFNTVVAFFKNSFPFVAQMVLDI